MTERVNKYVDAALNSLFPQVCLLCGAGSGRGIALCAPCEAELPRNDAACAGCALPLPSRAVPGSGPAETYCGHCLGQAPPFDSAVAPYLYDAQLALLLQRWKYQPQPVLGRLAAMLWAAALPAALPAVDALLPVPLHWRKLLRRGFNQSLQLCLLGRGLHPALAAPILPARTVRRQRATPAQAGLDARTRRDNLRGAFTLRGRCDNLRVAIVDDVITTGATASELALCLKTGGAREVHLWCLARTPATPW